MAKTSATSESVDAFLERLEDPRRREDARTVLALMHEITGEPPEMWGASIVGFGRYRNTLANGKVDLWPVVGFSPRKDALVLYLVPELLEDEARMTELGKCKSGKSCLYIKKLSDVDATVLRKLVATSVRAMAPKRVKP